MFQVPDICLSPRPISLLGTIMITGTIALSVAGLQGSTGQNTVIETFSQKGTSDFRTMGSTKPRVISQSGSAYLMEDMKETNREHAYLPQLRSIINIIAEYPSTEIVENDPQIGSNLPEFSMYEILANGSMMSMTQCLTCSFATSVAYNTSGYTDLGSYENRVAPIPNELEVMIMTEQLKQLTLDLRELDKKYDGKMDALGNKMDSKIDDLGNKMDLRFNKLEEKIGAMSTRLVEISDRLTDKVNATNIEVTEIKTKIDRNNTLTEKFKIPLIVAVIAGLIVVFANHSPAIFRALAGGTP